MILLNKIVFVEICNSKDYCLVWNIYVVIMGFYGMKLLNESVIFFLCIVEVSEYNGEVFWVMYILFERV